MGLLEFNKLPINTLVGADWKTFKAITAGREIDAAYKGKYRLPPALHTRVPSSRIISFPTSRMVLSVT